MGKLTPKILAGTVAVAIIAMQGRPAGAQTNIDVSAAGKAIHPEILGGTLVFSREVMTGNHASQVGLAGGLDAETFNWQTLQNGLPLPAYALMKSTDVNFDSMFLPIVNMRGVYDSNNAYKTDLAPLVTLASDWVRYSNFIIQNGLPYASQSAGDQAILNKLNWGVSQKLPNSGETPPPPVKYWIIGNEPEIKVNGKWFSSNWIDTTFGGAWTTAEYVNRYKQITSAMKAQDPTIKVGPGMLGGANEDTFGPLLQSDATIDFWAYHMYGTLSDHYVANGNASQVTAMETALKGVRPMQVNRLNAIRQTFINNGRNPDNVEFMVTEYNPMNGELAEADIPSMYQALGFAETMFAFAQLGIKSGNYWGETVKQPDIPNPNPADIYPMVKAWWKLRDEMGDTLVESIIDDANNRRIYTTRDSQTGEIRIWGLNLDNDTDTSINLSLSGISAADTAWLSVLGGTGTRLWTTSEEWTTQSLSNFNAANFNLNIPSASIVLLEIQPVPEPSAVLLLGLAGCGVLSRRHRM